MLNENKKLNDFINQAIGFSATQLEYPRDFTDIQVEEGVPGYTLPDDFIFLRTAYFGDKDKSVVGFPMQLHVTNKKIGRFKNQNR